MASPTTTYRARRTPSESSSRVAKARDDLIARARLLLRHSREEGASMTAPFLLDYFSSDGPHYDARWSLRELLFADDALALSLVLDEGLPIESPIAFAMGSLLSEACLVGAPDCVETLLVRGALPNTVNDHLDFPIELAARQACEKPLCLEVMRLLIEAGCAHAPSERFKFLSSYMKAAEIPFSRQPKALGWLMLREASHCWENLVSSASIQGRSFAHLVEQTLDSLERMRKICSTEPLPLDEFVGGDFQTIIESLELPLDLASAMTARLEREGLSLYVPLASPRADGSPHSI